MVIYLPQHFEVALQLPSATDLVPVCFCPVPLLKCLVVGTEGSLFFTWYSLSYCHPDLQQVCSMFQTEATVRQEQRCFAFALGSSSDPDDTQVPVLFHNIGSQHKQRQDCIHRIHEICLWFMPLHLLPGLGQCSRISFFQTLYYFSSFQVTAN